jgi:hypothetical protein
MYSFVSTYKRDNILLVHLISISKKSKLLLHCIPVIGSLLTLRNAEQITLSSSVVKALLLLDTFFFAPLSDFVDGAS